MPQLQKVRVKSFGNFTTQNLPKHLSFSETPAKLKNVADSSSTAITYNRITNLNVSIVHNTSMSRQ